jgi:prevent-host-death family protein
MKTMQLREAKAKFSALVEAAERGETTVVTKHGRPAAKLVPVDDDPRTRRRAKKAPSLVEYLRSMPADIPIERDQTPPREVDL